jgi:hypothetical protein
MRTIVEWFDPKNVRHLAAFSFYCNNGVWPNFTIPENVVFPGTNVWIVEILDKIMETKL